MATYDDLSTLDGLTKRVYGRGVHQAIPDNSKSIYSLFPFAPNQERLGDKFVEAVNLALEQGVTRTTGTAGVVTLNQSIASVVKQAIVDASAIIILAQISWDVVAKARSANSAQSFQSSLTQVVDNALLSHRRHQCADMLYGGDNIGVIKTGVAGSTQTLLEKSVAPAIWYGSTGMLVDIYDPTLTTKRNASPLSLSGYKVDPGSAARTLTFGASVTTTTNDVVVFAGSVIGGVYVTPPGLSMIASTQNSTLFSISQTSYPVFSASVYDAGGAALNMSKIDAATIYPLIRGYSGKMVLLVHPLTFANIAAEEVARIQLVGGSTKGSVEVGYNKVRFITASGANVECEPTPWMKEGEAYVIPDDGTCKRIGAEEIRLGAPSDPSPTWRRIEGSTGYSLPTYSLQAMFTPEPWKLVKIQNIVNSVP